jgi:hypothetical protein
MLVMVGNAADAGLYKRFRCHHCGREMDLVITVVQLASHRRTGKGLIEAMLSHEQYETFRKFATIDKMVTALGKFYDAYQRWPNESELSGFIGLTEQTVSKYVSRTSVIASEAQQKGQDGRFEEKRFYLTDEGKRRYAELTYELMGYKDAA